MNTKGFTLVELLVVAVLTVIVAGGLLTAFLTGQTSYFSADAYVQVQQEARRAFDAMVRELREAGPTAGAGTLMNVSGNQLNFQVAMDYTSAIQWGDGVTANNWIHYWLFTNNSLSNNNQVQLLRCTSGAPGTAFASPAAVVPANCRVLANNVIVPTAPQIVFQLDNAATPRIVTINLQVRYNSGLLPGGSQSLGTQTAPLTSRVRLRNAT